MSRKTKIHGHTWWHKTLDKKLGTWLRETFTECAYCNKPNYLQVSHILPKGAYPHLRYDPINILPMCGHCHNFIWHANPVESGKWFERNYPQRKEYLDEAKLIYIKRNLAYYQKVDFALNHKKIRDLMILNNTTYAT